MRITPYQQRPNPGAPVASSRWSILLNASLVTVAFVFLGAITFGFLG